MISKNELDNKLNTLIDKTLLVQKIYNTLKDNCDVFLVGGVVRDIASKKEVKDIDICIPIDIETATKYLKKSFKVIETGKKHGTVTVFDKNLSIEITEFRGEKNNLTSDLSLRDFTINAVAYSVKERKIFDPFNGLNDLENNILKCPINPDKVFLDDPLRMLRMFRFSYAENRTPENNLIISAKKNIEKIRSVSIERIKDELSNILISPAPSLALEKLDEFGFLGTLFPELSKMKGCTQNKYHKADVFFHTLDVISNTPPILEVRLAALLHDVGKPKCISIDENNERHFYGHEKISVQIAKKFLERLCFPKKIQATVLNAVSLHMRSLEAGPSGIRRLIKDIGNNFDIWFSLIKADKPPMMSDMDFKKKLENFLINYKKEIELKEKEDFLKLKVSGEDVMKIFNLPEGKEVGKIKKKLEEIVLEDPSKNTKEFLFDFLRKLKEKH